MKTLLASITSRVEAFNSIKSLFEKHENLTRICLTYYIEEDDSQLLLRFPTLQIGDQIWDDEEDDELGFDGYNGFAEITNSEILHEKELDALEEALHILLYEDTEKDCEDIIITREEILRTKVGFLIS